MARSISSKALRTLIGLMAVLMLAAVACGTTAPTATSVPPPTATSAPAPTATSTPEPAAAQLFVLSNSSPHVSVIDTKTNKVIKTADIPDFTSWTWIDNNNYFDGTNLWVGLKHPDTTDVQVIKLNLDTLEVAGSLPLGAPRR